MILRSLIITLFSAVLALTSVTLAVAQHSQVGVRSIVLCSSLGDQTIILDAQGNPVPFAHPCPDCVAAIAAQDLPHAIQLPLPPLVRGMQIADFVPRIAHGRAIPVARARGPPLADVA
ncbi:MAG: hypothetical protein U5N55_08140 [Cypionkella sp.]|nr:hypothetical protein [Cypionkella sp.]